MADAVLDKFNISLEGMEEVSRRLLDQMNKGLESDDSGSKVKMLITYVHSLPDGSENGDFLALDLGGSNFRVLLIKIKDGEIEQIDKKLVVDDKTKKSTQERLFNFIVDCLKEFVAEHKLTKKLPLGFTFSFPVHQTSLVDGKLIRWTKDFDADGAVGENVVELLRDAVKRRGGIDIDVVALVNDTTGTQMAIGHKDQDCHVGLILGTGTNACYTERLDAVKKFTGDRSRYSQVIINTEWGAFGDDGKLSEWMTPADTALDQFITNKGEQLYEKMISGKYIGELVRLTMQQLIKEGLLFGGKSSATLDTFEKFESQFVSTIEKGDGSDVSSCKKLLKDKCDIDASDDDCRLVRRVCEAVSTRAARLAAAGIVTLVRKIDKLSKCTVAVDGSLYKYHPKFPGRMRAAMDEMAPGNGIKMSESEDGSGRGAAMIAAVACRLAAAGEYSS